MSARFSVPAAFIARSAETITAIPPLSSPAPGPVASSPFRDALIESIEELFLRAQRSGVIRPDAVPTDVAPIFGMMGVAIDMAAASSPELWRRYLQLWFDGLRAQGLEPLATPPLAIEDVSAALAAGKRHK